MKKFRLISFSILLAGIFTFGFSQQDFKVTQSSHLVVEGTSTLHNFELTSKTVTGDVIISQNGKNITLDKISITVPVKELHSGKDGMDENMYESMNAESHPSITFESSSISNGTLNDSGKSQLTVSGVLTINGTPKQVSLNVSTISDKGGYVFEGSKSLLMSDYGIEPPSMFFGTVKTGDQVTIKFSVSAESNTTKNQAGL